RCFFQELPLLLEQQPPPAQLAQLLALITAQALALTTLDLRLLHPQAQRLPRHTEIAGDLSERPISTSVKRHRLTPKLRRIRPSILRLPWHGQTAFLPGRITQRSAVHESGGIPTTSAGSPMSSCSGTSGRRPRSASCAAHSPGSPPKGSEPSE